MNKSNMKMDGRILRKFQGRGIKIDGVNSIRFAKPLIFFNILHAVVR